MRIGACQPPRNKVVAKPVMANIPMYSAMKNVAYLKPEYSVMCPANFRFAFRHIERSAVRFHQAGHKKQNECGRAPRRKDEPPRHKAERVAALRGDNRVGYE